MHRATHVPSSEVAVIVTIPFESAFTTPSATLATVGSDDSQIRVLFVASSGTKVTFTVN